MPMTQQQAAQVLRRNAPPGEFPAFINPQEAKVLKGMGGAGKKTKSGLRSYFLSGLLGGGSKPQTSTSSVELDPEVKAMRKKTFDLASQAAAKPHEKFEGQRFAGAGKDTLAAHERARAGFGGQPTYAAAQTAGQGVTGAPEVGRQSFLDPTGGSIQDHMAPQTGVLDEIGRRGREGIRKSINELQGQQNKAFDGSFHSRGDLMKGTAIAEGQKNITAAETQYLDKIFGDAADRKETQMKMEADRLGRGADRHLTGEELKLRGQNVAMDAADRARAAGVQDTRMLSQVGADLENRAQNQLDFDYEDFRGQRDHKKNQASWLSNMVAAAPGGQTGQTTNPYDPGNPLSEAFGAGLSAYGATGNPYVGLAGAGVSLLS